MIAASAISEAMKTSLREKPIGDRPGGQREAGAAAGTRRDRRGRGEAGSARCRRPASRPRRTPSRARTRTAIDDAEQPRVVALAQHGWQPPPHRTARVSLRCGRARSRPRRRGTAAARRGARAVRRADARARVSGSAARTWRRSAARRPGPCSGTRSWRGAPTGRASRCSTTCPAASASAAGPGTSRPARRSPRRRSCPAGSPSRWPRRTASSCRTALDDATGTYVEPLACVLRGAERVPRGRVLVVGHGFVGPALRGGAAPARRRGLRDRLEPGARRAGARRPGRRGRPVRTGGAARRASRRAAPSSSSPARGRSTSTTSTGAS